MRGKGTRHWVKMYCDGCLHGSINYQLTLAEQAVWFKLIMLSAVRCHNAGTISDNDGKPLPHEFIAHEIHCDIETLESTIKKCVAESRIEDDHDGLRITNFNEYQATEYDRQKPYRDAKKEREKTKYGEFQNVYLMDNEKGKLIEKFGEKGFQDRVEKLSCGIESKGYKYKSHYATILNWERMDDKLESKSKRSEQTTPRSRYKPVN